MQICNMFKKLKQRWGVNSLGLFLIISTFALGGTACSRIGKLLIGFWSDQHNVLWWIIYIVLITILWPICVIIISIPLGQFSFFKNYLSRVFKKLSGQASKKKTKTHKIAIFASGRGTNANNIISYFSNINNIEVSLLVTNNKQSGVIDVGRNDQIPCIIINHNDLNHPESLIKTLEKNNINTIVLAGFLKKIPEKITQKFAGNIINIHPALLPKYGGKGMYGEHVHKAVLANREQKSGITIHLVDDIYDNGEIIFQSSFDISSDETLESLSKKIAEQEHTHFPKVIHQFLEKQMLR